MGAGLRTGCAACFGSSKMARMVLCRLPDFAERRRPPGQCAWLGLLVTSRCMSCRPRNGPTLGWLAMVSNAMRRSPSDQERTAVTRCACQETASRIVNELHIGASYSTRTDVPLMRRHWCLLPQETRVRWPGWAVPTPARHDFRQPGNVQRAIGFSWAPYAVQAQAAIGFNSYKPIENNCINSRAKFSSGTRPVLSSSR